MQIEHLGLEGLKTLPNLHPLWVHFPIALLPMSLLLSVVTLWKGSLYSAVRWLLGASAASASLAVWSGLGAESGMPHNEAIHSLMESHELVGWIVLGGCFLMFGWSLWRDEDDKPRANYGFLVGLVLLNLVLVQQADLGGRMVYTHGAGVAPMMEKMSGEGHSHSHSQPETSSKPSESVQKTPESTRTSDSHDHSGHEH